MWGNKFENVNSSVLIMSTLMPLDLSVCICQKQSHLKLCCCVLQACTDHPWSDSDDWDAGTVTSALQLFCAAQKWRRMCCKHQFPLQTSLLERTGGAAWHNNTSPHTSTELGPFSWNLFPTLENLCNSVATRRRLWVRPSLKQQLKKS